MSDEITNKADVWRAKLKEQEAAREELTVEMEFAGLRGTFGRVPIVGWLKAGRVPQFLVHAPSVARGQSDSPQLKQGDLTPEQYEENMRFQRMAVCAVSRIPKIVDGEPKEDEISFDEIALINPQFLDEVTAWVLNNCPDIPVAVKGGETVTTEEVTNFRDESEGGASAESVAHGEGVSWQTEPTPRII